MPSARCEACALFRGSGDSRHSGPLPAPPLLGSPALCPLRWAPRGQSQGGPRSHHLPLASRAQDSLPSAQICRETSQMDRGEATCPQGCPRLPRLFTVSNVSFAQLNAGFYSRKQEFTLINRSKAHTWCCTRGGSGWGQAEGSLCPRPRQHTPPAGLSGGTSRQRGTMVQTAGRRSVTGQDCRQPSAAVSEEGRKTAVGVSPPKRRSWNLQQAQLSCLLPETCQDCQRGEENR